MADDEYTSQTWRRQPGKTIPMSTEADFLLLNTLIKITH